ncbi:MAG: hypothetical protein GY862_01595, partial [Gammaproteobacteria bacterium]|nr:hypothetical protein [Gammaproteobacteria bacterium]
MSKRPAEITEPSTESFELAVKSDYWDEPRTVYVYPSGRGSTDIYGDVIVQGLVFPPPMPVRLAENQIFSKKMNITEDFYSDVKIQYPGEYEVFAEFMEMGSNVIKINLKEDVENISYLIRALEEKTEQTMLTMPSSKWAAATLRRLTGQNYGFIYNLDRGWHARKKINLWKKWFARHKDALHWNKEKKMYEITPPINDGDNDGVGDRKDKCPDTEKGMATGADGCPRDGDGDGVADHADKCPDNAEYQLSQGVNSDGCPPDSDGDGVA